MTSTCMEKTGRGGRMRGGSSGLWPETNTSLEGTTLPRHSVVRHEVGREPEKGVVCFIRIQQTAKNRASKRSRKLT